jgi:hypothetical protein
MTRFFAVWLLLGVAAALVTLGLGLAVFRVVDLTFAQFAILFVAPGVQAAVLTWPGGVIPRALTAVAQARRHSLGGPVLLLEGLLLVAGLALWSTSVLGFGTIGTVQPTWIAVKAAAVGALALWGLPSAPASGRAMLAVTAGVIAVQAFDSRVELAVQWMVATVTDVPEVWVRLGSYGGLYGLGLAGLRHVGRTCSDAGRFWTTVAVALSVPAAVLVVLAMFNHPGVIPPWRGPAVACASAGVTALLLAVLTEASAPKGRL